VYSSNWESEITPMSEENSAKPSKGKSAESVMGDESIIDLGKSDAFESAWGKAVDNAKVS